MTAADQRRGFEAMAAAGGGDARALAAGLKRESTGIGLRALSALVMHAAIAAPERIPATYDAAAKGWFGKDVNAAAIRPNPVKGAPISPAFWGALWLVALGWVGKASFPSLISPKMRISHLAT